MVRAVYPWFREYVKRAAFDGRRIDPRATRVLLEHKSLLGQILSFVGRADVPAGWPGDFRAIEAIASRINLMVGIFTLRFVADIAQEIGTALAELHRLESLTLTAALAAWPSSPTSPRPSS